MQLAPQAKEILGKSDVVMITARVDEVARRIGPMGKMGLPEVWDRPIPRPGTPRGRSGGWTAVIGRADSSTEGDHRTVSVATDRKGRHHTLSHLTAPVIEPRDLSDDRLSPLRPHVRQPASWHHSERDLQARSIAVHAWPQDVLRGDATTVSGDHEVTAGGLLPFGQRHDDPTRPQINVLMGSLAPVGRPLSTEVWSGERADDGFYIPLIERSRIGLNHTGLRCVGECQMRAWDTRADLARPQDWDVSPWPLTGATAAAMDAWITAGVTPGEAGAFGRRWRTTDRGHEGLAAEGDACERTWGAPVGDMAWRERVLGRRSPRQADPQATGLANRLRHAETQLTALTPPSGRGTRQITDDATLVEAMDRGRQEPRVTGWLSVTWEKPVEQTTPYVGRGRGSVSRATRVIQKTRDPITHLARPADTLAARSQRVGWKACVTKAGQTRLSLPAAVWGSRHEYRVERLFNRRKSRVPIAPRLVKLNAPIEGLTDLLTLGVRV